MKFLFENIILLSYKWKNYKIRIKFLISIIIKALTKFTFLIYKLKKVLNV